MKRFLLILGFIIIFASGCSNKVSQPNIKSNANAGNIIHDIQLNPKVKDIISDDPQKYVNNMRCTYENINQILNYAKEYGIENPYIPTEGIATDYIMEIRKEDGVLQIVYPHFSVCESSKEISSHSKDVQERSVKLSIGNGVWRGVQQNAPQLYLRLNGVYIAIDSARYFDENGYIKVAESMVQIKK